MHNSTSLLYTTSIIIYCQPTLFTELCFISKHIQAMDALKQALTATEVEYTEIRFNSDEGINGIGTDFFVSVLLKCEQCKFRNIFLWFEGSKNQNLCIGSI